MPTVYRGPLRTLVMRLCAEGVPDRDLLARFGATEDAAAFAELVERHGRMVLSLCQRVLGDHHAAEDAFQATFLVLARKAGTLRQPERLAGWLYGVAGKIALRMRRQRHADRSLDREPAAPSVDPLEALCAREVIAVVEEELARLPERYRLPLILCAIEGGTVEEAARLLATSPGAIRGQLQRGRARLERRLQQLGLTLPAALTMVLAAPRGMVSAALLRTTVGLAIGSAPASATVAALAAAALATPAAKWAVTGASLLLVGVLGLGMGFLQATWPQAAPPEAKQTKPPDKAGDVRRDRDGQPLPDGVIARLGTLTLRGCAGPIQYTPDGQFFVCAVGSSRSQVGFFEPATGRRIFELDGGGSPMPSHRFQFSPDGKRMASAVPGSSHNPVWDMVNRKKLFKFEASEAGFSADGSRLIAVSFYGQGHCRVLDGASGKLLEEHALGANKGDKIASIDWAEVLPGGTAIVFHETRTRQFVVFDVTKNARTGTFPSDRGLASPSVSPDGRTLAIPNVQNVRLVELSTGKEIGHWKQGSGSRVVFSGDGKRLAWTGMDEDGSLYPWVAEAAGASPRRLGSPTNDFAPPCFTPDGNALVVLHDGGVPEWRDFVTGKELRPRDAHNGRVWEVRPLPDGKHLISRDHNRLLVWNQPAAKLVRRYPDDLPEGETHLYSVSQTGHVLTAHANTGILRLRELISGRELLKLHGGHGSYVGGFSNVAISHDGKAAALVSSDYQIRVYDLITGKVRRVFDPQAPVVHLDLSHDGRYLQWKGQTRVGGKNVDGPFVIDTFTGQEQVGAKQFTKSHNERWSSYSNDETRKQLTELNLVDSKGKRIDSQWPRSVFDVISSPDSRYIAVHYSGEPPGSKGVPDRLGIWDVETHKPLDHLKLEPGTLRFSPDSRLVLTTTLEGVIDIWEIATGQKRLSLKGHLPGQISTLAFLPGRRTLASGSADTQVLLWDLTGCTPDGVWRAFKHSPEKLRELWSALAAPDAAVAHRAIWELAADPAGAVPFLAQHLRPDAAADARRMAQMIANLDSEAFATRSRAIGELAKLGEADLPALRVALQKATSLEQKRRLQSLVDDLTRPDLASERLRAARAVEVLDYIATPAARAVLENVASGLATARLTRDAQATLRRWQQ
jgi:RNA polymerase sigma factor (sigma-70 family)